MLVAQDGDEGARGAGRSRGLAAERGDARIDAAVCAEFCRRSFVVVSYRRKRRRYCAMFRFNIPNANDGEQTWPTPYDDAVAQQHAAVRVIR